MTCCGESETIESCIILNKDIGLPDVRLKRTAVVIKGFVKEIFIRLQALVVSGLPFRSVRKSSSFVFWGSSESHLSSQHTERYSFRFYCYALLMLPHPVPTGA